MTNKSFYKDAPSYCHFYFDLVETDNLLTELEKSKTVSQALFGLITPELENYSYQTNKWTIKQVIRHIIDCERVYTYRAFRFSRFDNTELAGFDENKYIDSVKNVEQDFFDLVTEYLAVRNATISLFKAMTSEMLNCQGVANNVIFTPLSLGFMVVGHNIHHVNYIKMNYLGDK
jgi:hypothetical protein